MVWLAVLALAIWVLVEHGRTTKLADEFARLRARLAGEAPTPTATRPAAPITTAQRVAPEPALIAVPSPAPAVSPRPIAPTPQPAPPAQRPAAPAITRAAVETWLSEKGLAWIGGSALVIGGALLVGYAVRRGIFTPMLRLAAAAALGVLFGAAGEALRRGRLPGFGRNALVAALASGAAAAILYADAWAAYGIYGYIPVAACAALLIAIAAGLLALSLLHGEPLAVLALAGAFAAPLISGGDWDIAMLSLYMGLLVAVGLAVAWLRGWSFAGGAVLAGAFVWAFIAGFGDKPAQTLLLGLEPLAVLALLAYLRARPTRILALGATVLAGLAMLLPAVAMPAATFVPPIAVDRIAAALALIGLAAALHSRQHTAAVGLGVVGGFLTAAALFVRLSAPADMTWAWSLLPPALGVGGVLAAHGQPRAAARSAAGAIGGAVLGLIAGEAWHAGAPFVAISACAVGTLGAVWHARRPAKAHDAAGVDLWAAAAAAALFIAVGESVAWRWLPFAFAASVLVLGALANRLGWRSLGRGAAAGALLAFLSLFQGPLLALALGSRDGAVLFLAAGLAVAAASLAAARMAAADRPAAEALQTVAPLAVLSGAFVFLRWFAAHGVPLDALGEDGARTLLLGAGGLVGLALLGAQPSLFAKLRAHALVVAAILYGLLAQLDMHNPRIGAASDLVSGVAVFNSLAIAYLAPAGLFALAAARAYRTTRPLGRIYALAALLFGLSWAFLELRRDAVGPHLGGAVLAVSPIEGIGDSLVLLGVAAAFGFVRRFARREGHPFWGDARASLTAGRLVAAGFAILVAAWWSNPWFGPFAEALASPIALWFTIGAYLLATGLIAWLAVDAREEAKSVESRVLTDAAVLFGLVAATLAVRAAFQGADMTFGRAATQPEVWTYSAVWAALGLGLIVSSRGGERLFLRAGVMVLLLTTAKVFIVDTANLSGVVRATSFLGLGVLLLLGALTARRIAERLAPGADHHEGSPS